MKEESVNSKSSWNAFYSKRITVSLPIIFLANCAPLGTIITCPLHIIQDQQDHAILLCFLGHSGMFLKRRAGLMFCNRARVFPFCCWFCCSCTVTACPFQCKSTEYTSLARINWAPSSWPIFCTVRFCTEKYFGIPLFSKQQRTRQ